MRAIAKQFQQDQIPKYSDLKNKMKRVVGTRTNLEVNEVPVQLNGVWHELEAQKHAANLKFQEVNAQLTATTQERDLLRFEIDELQVKFKQNLASLTEASSTNLSMKEIFSQIKAEKEKLENKVFALESHQDWMNERFKQLAKEKDEAEAKLLYATTQQELAYEELSKVRQTNTMLENAMMTQDNKIDELLSQLNALKHENQILKKAIDGKNKVYQSILKEKTSLQTQLEHLQSSLNQARLKSNKVIKNPKTNNLAEQVQESNHVFVDENSSRTLTAENNYTPPKKSVMVETSPDSVAAMISELCNPLEIKKQLLFNDGDNTRNPWSHRTQQSHLVRSNSTSRMTERRNISTPKKPLPSKNKII